MNLQKINKNIPVPALVFAGLLGPQPSVTGRAALPQPVSAAPGPGAHGRGSRVAAVRAVLVLTRMSIAHGGPTAPHILHSGGGPAARSSGASRPATGTCSGWSRPPACGRVPGLREGQFRTFSHSDVSETPSFTPSPKGRPGGGGSGEAAGPRASLRASPWGRAASRAATYISYMCPGPGPKHTYSSVSVYRYLGSSLRAALRFRQQRGSRASPRRAAPAGCSALPGSSPGEASRPLSPLSGGGGHRESKETSLGVRQLLPGCPGSVCVPAPPRHVRLFSVPEKHYRIVTSSHTIIP